jgi:hypothetical protein
LLRAFLEDTTRVRVFLAENSQGLGSTVWRIFHQRVDISTVEPTVVLVNWSSLVQVFSTVQKKKNAIFDGEIPLKKIVPGVCPIYTVYSH